MRSPRHSLHLKDRLLDRRHANYRRLPTPAIASEALEPGHPLAFCLPQFVIRNLNLQNTERK